MSYANCRKQFYFKTVQITLLGIILLLILFYVIAIIAWFSFWFQFYISKIHQFSGHSTQSAAHLPPAWDRSQWPLAAVLPAPCMLAAKSRRFAREAALCSRITAGAEYAPPLNYSYVNRTVYMPFSYAVTQWRTRIITRALDRCLLVTLDMHFKSWLVILLWFPKA